VYINKLLYTKYPKMGRMNGGSCAFLVDHVYSMSTKLLKKEAALEFVRRWGVERVTQVPKAFSPEGRSIPARCAT
jgi:hypothetical protein